MAPFNVETPDYFPFEVEDKYGKFIGFDRVKLVYKNSDESLTVWVTSEIGWNNVSSWDEQITLSDGNKAYYNKSDKTQMISWRNNNVEYAIDYEGNKLLDKNELIKFASSIK